jgi:D-lactate dehydrogenase (cytochrome)
MDQSIQSLQSIVGRSGVLTDPEELLVYECDGLPQHKYLPRAVVFPESTEAVAEVMRTLARFRVPFTPRGAGTGLSGGALAINRGVVVELARMRSILSIDAAERIAVVQTGVVNLHVSKAVAHLGLHYVPDPSSQPTCTIGGNIAENAGGIHCLKYGTTTDHVLGARVVLSDGQIVDLVSGETGRPGYDLLGVFVGSEGTFGIATEATLRLTPLPEAIRTLLAEFADVDDASRAVSAIIAAGVMPAALEMMDREIIRAIEASVFAAGLPPDAGAALLIELDGLAAGIDDEAEKVRSICMQHGARNCRLAHDEAERKKLWAARKGAFGAVGRIAPDSMIQDAVVPRSRLPEIMQQSYRIAAKYQLVLANVFHAGDGNLHPLICFDSRSSDEVRRVKEAGRELMETCVRAGGSITGEHGVGLDKRDYLPLIFSEDDMDTMLRVRRAFDPEGICNPGKILPTLRGCGEGRSIATTIADSGLGLGVAEVSSEPATPNVEKSSHERRTAPNVNLAEEIASLVGNSNVTTEGDVISASPGSIEQVSKVMKLASGAGRIVVPTGAGSWLRNNHKAGRQVVVVNTLRLNHICEHEPADLIARAEAGVTLREFNAQLRSRGQWLPLDPPGLGNETLGGVIATGLGGAQKLGYGPPRRFVIGMTVVRADGKVIKVGGKVVKNVAGYDLSKLFTGSYGTLGMIAELNFKLRPVPASTATVALSGSSESLFSVASSIDARLLSPVALEIFSRGIVDGLVPTSGLALMVRFAGPEKAVAYQIEETKQIADRSAGVKFTLIENDDKLWKSVAAIPYLDSGATVSRVVVPSQFVPEVVASLDEDDHWQAGFATGTIRVFTTVSGAIRERLGRLRYKVRKLQGSMIVESASEEIKHDSDVWDDLGHAKSLMDRIKLELDPDGILPRVRF